MKRTIIFIMAAALAAAMTGCGKKAETGSGVVGDGKDKPAATAATQATAAAEATAFPTVSATQPPFVDSNETQVVTAQEVPISEKKEDFEKSSEPEQFTKYVSGDNRWGILLPKEARAADEDEGGAIFVLNQNTIAVNTMTEPVELKSAEEAKKYFSVLANVKLNSFKVIYDGNTYAGCCFDFESPTGIFGFGKYAVKGKNAASAAAMNMAGDAALNDLLRDTVNSLVVFE